MNTIGFFYKVSSLQLVVDHCSGYGCNVLDRKSWRHPSVSRTTFCWPRGLATIINTGEDCQLYCRTTSRQGSCNLRVAWLLCSIARIYNLWNGSMDKREVRGLIPCCGHYGYRAQVPQHPLDS